MRCFIFLILPKYVTKFPYIYKVILSCKVVFKCHNGTDTDYYFYCFLLYKTKIGENDQR